MSSIVYLHSGSEGQGNKTEACFTPAQYVNLTDGHYMFSVTASDRVGNEAEPVESEFLVDTQPPTISHISYPLGSKIGDISVSFIASDGAGSGINSIACK